jgi:hypothetical protein
MVTLRSITPVVTVALSAVLSTMAFTVLVSAGAPPAVSSPDAGSLRTEVARLLQQLDSNRISVRRAAEVRLREIGAAGLEFYPPMDAPIPPGVKTILDRIRPEIERKHAASLLEPTTITATGTRTLAAWAAELQRQTGNPVSMEMCPESIQQRELDLAFESTLFWEAADRIAAAAGLVAELNPELPRLELRPRTTNDPPVDSPGSYVGAWRARVKPIRTNSRRSDLLHLSIGLHAEPRLRPLYAVAAANRIHVESEAGQFPPFNPLAQVERTAGGEGHRSILLETEFLRPAADVGSPVRVHGDCVATVATGAAELRFERFAEQADKVDRPLKRRRGGVVGEIRKVTIPEAEAGETRTYIVSAAIAWEGPAVAFESHRTWMLYNEVSLHDPGSGARFDLNGGFSTSDQGDGLVVIDYTFRDVPPRFHAADFVLTAPTLITEQTVRLNWPRVPMLPAVKP